MNNLQKRVAHFEMPYDDEKRASEFYEKVFGWKLFNMPIGDMNYAMAQTGPTDESGMPTEAGFINGALMPKSDKAKNPVIVMATDDVNAEIKMVQEHGGEKMMDPVPVGDMGFYAYVKDTEGNVIGLWQDKKREM